ncbi:MAG: T9SS type A sorting domain-containing protein [Bacteroidales bacterium]|nr:T9SS type A sorting domain-containing protein [Bacteroidales bacterium]
MKKTFTILLLLLLIVKFTSADSVDKKDAQRVAENFIRAQISEKGTNLTVSNISTFEFQGETTMYIISFNPMGFVVVSADDRANPIIGYSTTNSVGDGLNNPSVTNRFELYSKQINETKLQKAQNIEVKQRWENYKVGQPAKILAAVSPLITTTWNQQGTIAVPTYNLFCPNHDYTGCVATAMAQIMNYHKWPAQGQGWHKYTPQTNPSYGIQYVDFSSVSYDWVNMPNYLNGSSSTTQKEAIATLMYHAGVSVNMDYASDGSAAFSADVMYALTNYFKYDPTTIKEYEFDASKVTEWLTIVKGELNQNRPIYYSGQGTSGGHAWVCDGYDASDNLHINWGWGGYLNGYFVASEMDPDATTNFSTSNSIIVGIKPGQVNQSILWKKQSSGFTAAGRGIQNISAVSDRIAWAVAFDGSAANPAAKVKDFTRTIDGGFTWYSGTINASGTTNYSAAMISAVSDKKAWVALFGPTGGGKIVNTTDGGATWQVQSTATFSSPNGFPNVVYFWDENNGFCMGDPNGGYFEIYTTTNGGSTWSRVSSSKIPSNSTGEYGNVSYYSVYGNTVWFSTNKGRIYKSIDKGYNWTAYQTPITDASFELSFKDDNIGIIQRRGTGSNPSYKTINGGQNWTLLTSTGNFYKSSFMFIPGSNLLISTGADYTTPAEGVSYSTDNGSTFTDYAEFYKSYQFLAIGAASDKSIWAGGFSSNQYYGGMWHYGAIPISADFKVNNTLAHQNDSTVVFTDKSYGSPETWSWNFGDGALPQTKTGVGPHTIKYTTTGNKTITLTVTKGTDQQIYVKENYVAVTWPVDVETNDISKKYSVFPNPATTIIKIDGYEKGTVKVFSSTGALVLDIVSLPSDKSLNISSLSSGVYFIKIQTPDGKSVTKKLSILK